MVCTVIEDNGYNDITVEHTNRTKFKRGTISNFNIVNAKKRISSKTKSN